MFIISLTYKVPLEQVDAALPHHREYLQAEGIDKGLLVVSGPKVPRTGGVIVFNSTNLTAVEAFIAHDPFFIKGIADYDVTEFEAKLMDSRLE